MANRGLPLKQPRTDIMNLASTLKCNIYYLSFVLKLVMLVSGDI